MGTRANVAVKVGDEYRVIYTHWDGYPSHHLPILQGHYNSQERAELLVSFGDASQLEERCIPNGPHSFENKEEGCTVYYGRDRGEGGAECTVLSPPMGLKVDNEYLYYFDGDSWKWTSNGNEWFSEIGKD